MNTHTSPVNRPVFFAPCSFLVSPPSGPPEPAERAPGVRTRGGAPGVVQTPRARVWTSSSAPLSPSSLPPEKQVRHSASAGCVSDRVTQRVAKWSLAVTLPLGVPKAPHCPEPASQHPAAHPTAPSKFNQPGSTTISPVMMHICMSVRLCMYGWMYGACVCVCVCVCGCGGWCVCVYVCECVRVHL